MTTPAAVLFGSIGTLAETSEMQREAFNRAFALAGLGWRWNRSLYQALLEDHRADANRIEAFALSRGQVVDARSQSMSPKHAIYHQLLAGKAAWTCVTGVAETMARGPETNGIRLGLVSTTGRRQYRAACWWHWRRLAPVTCSIISLPMASQVNATESLIRKPIIWLSRSSNFALVRAMPLPLRTRAASLTASVDAGIATVAFPRRKCLWRRLCPGRVPSLR